MDEIEKFIKEDVLNSRANSSIDIDAVIAGTHATIRKRATRRKVVYSSPVVALLLMMVITLFPERGTESMLPEGELFMAGWEFSWTETQDLNFDQDEYDDFYDQSIEYLIDEHSYSYIDDAEEVLDEIDYEAFLGYLKEV